MLKNLLYMLCLLIAADCAYAQETGQLIVFTQPDQPISQHFSQNYLAGVKALANERGLEFRQVNVAEGAPAEVSHTPMVLFQNHLGRSVYRGRYSTLERLTNFVRTVKNAPQQNAQNIRENMPVMQLGRSVLATPIKVTELAGIDGKNFDQAGFQAEARAAIASGFSGLELKASVELPGNARLFYQDYHPYLTANGKLYVSTHLFSMFSCVEPVFESTEAWEGTWGNRTELFASIGAHMELVTLQQLKQLEHGDAFEPVRDDAPLKSWAELGLDLPAPPVSTLEKNITTASLGTNWTFDQALQDGSPLVQFAFGAPVDHYAGEARSVRMQLELGKKRALLGATGHVVVETSTITMGDDGLDDHIFEDYLAVLDYPNATYEFEITKAPATWDIGTSQEIELTGTFSMIGKPVALSASGRVDVVAGPDGKPRLKMHGNFVLPLMQLYGIKGPDGPSPAKDELQFYLNFLLKPAKKTSELNNDLFEATALEKTAEPTTDPSVDFIGWKARNKIYKANGSFEKWRITNFELPNGAISSMSATVEIDIHSLQEKSKLLVKHLQEADFFDAEQFPTGTIVIEHPTKQVDGSYKADGRATLLGITEPVPIVFTVINTAPLTVQGTAIINRNKFGIGKSKKAKSITEDVEVSFRLTAPETESP